MLLRDVRSAWRALTRDRTVSGVAIACLSLGIGINVMAFAMMDAILLKPFPFEDPEGIVVIHSTNERIGVDWGGISYADYRDLRERNTTLASVGAFMSRSLVLTDGASEAARVAGSAVTWNLFQILGIPPARGRAFGRGDDQAGAEPVALISHEVWTGRYGSEAAIVGRPISIDGRPHTIVGVMPPRFAFPQVARVWVPLGPLVENTPRGARDLQLFARLRPGVTLDQASADAASVASRLAAAYPEENRDWSASAAPLRDWLSVPDQPRLMLSLLMGAVTLVLAIACSNVANLLLARASIRHREISIRSALGGARLAIIRQLMAEAVMLGLASVPFAVLVAWSGLRLVDSIVPAEVALPYQWQWALDARALAYMVAVAVITGMVFGAAPAMHATGASLLESLREGGHGSTGERRGWLRSSLVVAQVALAVLLLIGSSLFIRTFFNLQGAGVGFDTAPLMTLRVSLGGERYASRHDDAKALRIDDIVSRIERLPGVEAAFGSAFVPMSGGAGGGQVVVDGKSVAAGQEPWIELVATTPHFRQTLGLALVRGRDVSDAEGRSRDGAPVALVNETMARRLWDGDNPVGRTFRFTGDGIPDLFTVVGVVADFRHFVGGGADAVPPAAYVPYRFGQSVNTGFVIRVHGQPAAIMSAVREQVRLSDSGIAIFQVMTMEDRRRLNFWDMRAIGIMFTLFGAVALALASIGVYGVLSYSVSQRTQEIGVRVALGAARGDLVRLVVGKGLKLAAIGVVLGTIAALLVTPVMGSLLYGVAPSDPASFIAVSAFLLGIAAAASYIPAKRAMAVDAIAAIRTR